MSPDADLCPMSKKEYQTNRAAISMDKEIAALGHQFALVKDSRASNTVYPLKDILMSGFAMFSLKHCSLLDFEQQSLPEKQNLRNVFGIENVCSDVQMRRVLDMHEPDFIRHIFVEKFKDLQKTGIADEYAYKIGMDSYHIVSCDGVQHFSSKTVSCPCCLKKEHKDGSTTYHHNMLCVALVHPEKREVFILNSEPIVQQDGVEKNDCERNAAKRLLKNMQTDYPEDIKTHRFLFVEDALYANVPHILDLQQNNCSFVLNVKPDSHKTLFAHVEGRRQRNQLDKWTYTQDGVKHEFEWANNLPLCNAYADVRVNFLRYQKTDKSGKTTTFTWITDILIKKNRVVGIMKAGRSRWKIENEAFNTLKNLGYQFEHNFGHGEDHLSTMFAYLMLLAFYMDQFIQACSKEFQQIELLFKTRIKLWAAMKAVFQTHFCRSVQDIYAHLLALYQVKLE